jgi:LPS export ABC transporter protein LptC
MRISKTQLKLIVGGMALAAIVLVAVLVYTARRPASAPSEALSKAAATAVMMLSKVHQTATQDGRIQWELKAESARLQDKGNRMILDSPQVEFTLEDGGKAYLTAAKGVLNTVTNDIQVRGNVRVRNDRYTLESEALDYNHTERLLRSKTPVRISSSTINLDADEMVYDLKTNQAQFFGAVEGNLNEKLPL